MKTRELYEIEYDTIEEVIEYATKLLEKKIKKYPRANMCVSIPLENGLVLQLFARNGRIVPIAQA